jgi:hypothetical protein
MNAFRGMDATPPDGSDPALAAQARRARRILLVAMAVMVGIPLLLFVVLHT